MNMKVRSPRHDKRVYIRDEAVHYLGEAVRT